MLELRAKSGEKSHTIHSRLHAVQYSHQRKLISMHTHYAVNYYDLVVYCIPNLTLTDARVYFTYFSEVYRVFSMSVVQQLGPWLCGPLSSGVESL